MTMQDYFPTKLPAPYPGECLYSIFSRYHVRSGNKNDSLTKEELFGSAGISLWGSVLSPYRLYSADRWGIPAPFLPKSRRILLTKHTAYQLYKPCIRFNLEQHYYDELVEKGKKEKSLVFPGRHYTKTNKLRYCPSCAQAEKKIYGEPYWHTIHQIAEVRYCPIHETPLLESEADCHGGSTHFQPAYTVLKSTNNNRSLELSGHDDKQTAITFAKDLMWISNTQDEQLNGQRFNRVYQHIKKEHNQQNHYFVLCKELGLEKKRTLSNYEKDILYEEPSLFPPISPGIAYTVIYLRVYFDGISSFFEKYIKDE